MADRLFDPDRLKPRAAAPREQQRPLSVSDLASRIEGALKAGIPGKLRVVGEVSGFRDRTHWYFDMKDGSAVVNTVMFASAARKAGFQPRNGLEVVAEGRIDFYAPSGRVSFIIDKLAPVGAGALELQLRALMKELRELGWFDPARKKPLPTFPRRIAVVTSKSGAALQDVIDTARRRFPGVELLIVDARMQGAQAAPEVAASIRGLSANAPRLGIDAIIVTRGGGSMEDLWAFNERIVAEAINACRIPVVAAIGHETDTTIAELVADERCATPTQAAMRLIPDRADLARQVDALSRRLRSGLGQRVTSERRWLESVEKRPVLARPETITEIRRDALTHASDRLRRSLGDALSREQRRIASLSVRLERRRPVAEHARRTERIGALSARLARAASRAIERRGRDLDALERELAVVGPLAVMQRGFSVTTKADGRVVRSPDDVRVGDQLVTRLADGRIESVVGAPGHPGPQSPGQAGPKRAGQAQAQDQAQSQTQADAPTPPQAKQDLPPRRRPSKPKKAKKPDNRDQMDLF